MSNSTDIKKRFILNYVPTKHDGVANRDNTVHSYEIFEPEGGFGNEKDGKPFAGFKAELTNGKGYRSFRFDRTVAMVQR